MPQPRSLVRGLDLNQAAKPGRDTFTSPGGRLGTEIERGTTPFRNDAWARAATLAGLGGLALAIGGVEYVLDREPGHALLMPALARFSGHHVMGPFGQWLPSFAHPFAFSLFTAMALPASIRARYLACAAWLVVNVAFELGQHSPFNTFLARAILDTFGSTLMTRSLANYFVRGTFDIGDVLSAVLGALAAAGVLSVVHRHLENPHEP